MFLRVRVLLLDVSSSSHNWSATTPHGPERREHRSPFHPHRPWDIPARTTLRHERRVDVSYQVEQPTQSDPSLRRVAPASRNPLIHCYGCEDILFGRLNDLDAHWLAFWFEREVHVVPRQTVLGFISRSVSGSFSSCGLQWLSYQEFFSRTNRTAGMVAGILPLQDLICNCAAQHV